MSLQVSKPISVVVRKAQQTRVKRHSTILKNFLNKTENATDFNTQQIHLDCDVFGKGHVKGDVSVKVIRTVTSVSWVFGFKLQWTL